VIRPWGKPLYPQGTFVILKGNLARSCVAKITGLKQTSLQAGARVRFGTAAMKAIMARKIKTGRDRDSMRGRKAAGIRKCCAILRLIGEALATGRPRHRRPFSGGTWGMLWHVARSHVADDRAGEEAPITIDARSAHPVERLRERARHTRKKWKHQAALHPWPSSHVTMTLVHRERGNHRRLRNRDRPVFYQEDSSGSGKNVVVPVIPGLIRTGLSMKLCGGLALSRDSSRISCCRCVGALGTMARFRPSP